MATTASTILTNRTLTTLVQTPSLQGIARILALSKGLLVMSYVEGLSAIIINSFQLWLLVKKLPSDGSSLLVVIKSLHKSDLLNGVLLLLSPTLSLIETEIFPGNKIILDITKFFGILGRRFDITVSTLLLCLLTATKMLKIVHSRSYTRLIHAYFL